MKTIVHRGRILPLQNLSSITKTTISDTKGPDWSKDKFSQFLWTALQVLSETKSSIWNKKEKYLETPSLKHIHQKMWTGMYEKERDNKWNLAGNPDT